MTILLALFQLRIKETIQYKASFFVTLFSQPVIFFINYSIFTTLYKYNNTTYIKGYTLEQMIWYFAASMIVSKLSFNNIDSNISQKIISGNLLYDLLRPASIELVALTTAVAHRIISLLIEVLPLFFLFFIWNFPVFLDIFVIIRFVILVMGCFVTFFYIRFIIGLLAFYLKENKGLIVISNILITFLGGGFFPLEFFPTQFNDFLNYLPFKYLFYWPVQFFLNRPLTDDIYFFLKIFGIQCGWIVIFFVCFRILLRSSLKKFCGAGG